MSEHPTHAELAAFLREALSPERFREIVQHLLKGCESCSAFLVPFYQSMTLEAAHAPVESDAEYDRAIDRAFERVQDHQRYARWETARARKFAPVLAAGGGVQALIDKVKEPLRGIGLYKALLERSWAVRHEDPSEMVTLARFAVEVAQNLDSSRYAAELQADLEARAWGELGNALRVADDLDEAERAFGTAFDLLALGSGEPLLKARLYDLHASYLGTRRQFELAFVSLDIVHAAYLDLNDPHLAGRALLIKAIYTHYNGQSEEAIRLNKDGLRLIDKDRDPSLAFFAIHNHLWFLVACGRFQEAKKTLFLSRRDLGNIKGQVNALKLRWLEGQISAGLKEWKSAESALREVRIGFERAGLGFAAALASLELALVWMQQGRYRESERLALDTVEVFVALRIRREALGAMMVLRDAFEQQKANVALLRGIVKYLRRLEVDSDAQFEPEG